MKTLAELVDTPEYTKLRPDLAGEDPDDSFSKVPYDKGSLFLFYLEHLVGLPAMLHWLRAYVTHFRTQSLDASQMRAHFETHMTQLLGAATSAAAFAQIDWDAWLYGVGLPPWDVQAAALDKSLAQVVEALAATWLASDGVRAT